MTYSPMDEAPRDGEYIWLYRQDMPPVLGFWNGRTQGFMALDDEKHLHGLVGWKLAADADVPPVTRRRLVAAPVPVTAVYGLEAARACVATRKTKQGAVTRRKIPQVTVINLKSRS